MPERSKRRKNNKNKRKNNKNVTTSVNKNITEDKETISIESGSDITNEDVVQNNTQIVKDFSENQFKPDEVLPLNVSSALSAEYEAQNCDDLKKEERHDESVVLPTYIVETPDQANTAKPKLDNGKKSKSCDNDDSPTIVEITEDKNTQSDQTLCAPVIDSSNVIISNEESDIAWENVDDFNLPSTELIEGVLSSTTIPLNIAHCEHTKILSPEEESSLRSYLQTLNLSTNNSNFNVGDIKTEIEHIINREVKYRLRRKGFAEDNIYPSAGPSRSLAVIDEEGSSGSSKTSRRQSYLSDKKSDNEELEDDVFETKQVQKLPSVNTDTINKPSSKHLIPQKCLRVDAKLKEPEISEARGDWKVETVEKMAGAELVYLTDSSSSTSSLYDINDDSNKGEDTDTSVRIITPTIEVTDTETLFTNSLVAKSDNKDVKQCQDNFINETKRVNKQVLNNTYNSSNITRFDTSDANLRSNDSSHEIVVLSTNDLKTNLYVKDLDEPENKVYVEKYHETKKDNDSLKLLTKSPDNIDEYDLEIKILKCELNDAINNLIKEVISDSENSNDNLNESLKRQDSSSSVDSSQCTAKYNPTNSSLNDISNLIKDEEIMNASKENTEQGILCSHVKDVLQCVTNKPTVNDKKIHMKNVQPLTLRDTCLKKISSFPFGDKILEELANVSQRLQNTVLASQSKDTISKTVSHRNENPPPIQPRKSSLKISQDEQNKPTVPPRTDSVYECLSPSQKMLMEKTNNFTNKDDVVQIVETYDNKKDFNVKNVQDVSLKNDTLEKVHMKSRTGSRLLALLRDTSSAPKLNSSSLHSTKSQTPKVKFNTESYSKKLLNEIDSVNIPSDSVQTYLPRKLENVSSYYYESDSGIRENSFRSLRNNKKYFHYSTGNLSKEIESDISSIQNMHRYCTNLRDKNKEVIAPRRPSLPKDLCDQQMEYICRKEKEIDAEIRRLEQEKNKPLRHRGPRAPMFSEKDYSCDVFDSKNKNYGEKFIKHDNHLNAERRKVSSLFSSSEEELLREKMYSEYINQIAEREQRKQQKVIKITQSPTNIHAISKSMPALEMLNSRNNRIEQEFISKAKERWYKLGIKDPETEDEQENEKNVYREPKIIEHKIKVIESGEEKDVQKLPTHMQEFVKFTVNDKDNEKCSTGESDSEQASAHVVVFCAVVILVLTVGKFLLRLFR